MLERAWMVSAALRRMGWVFGGRRTAARAANVALAGAELLRGAERVRSWPVVLKVDLSPLCNLRCVSCLHSDPAFDGEDPVRQAQRFRGDMKMSLARYRGLMHQVRERVSAISMYYFGDPLVHRALPEMCAATAEVGLASHVSTNFSFRLSDARLKSLLGSGLTHLTVCVDGLTQETYGLTRVGGDVALVLDNLERAMALRRAMGSRRPSVEVQHIRFQHNERERAEATRRFRAMGVDRVTSFWGNLHPQGQTAVSRYDVEGALPGGLVPRCLWPWLYMVVKWDGDVIPCCNHRTTTQYVDDRAASRAVGNVFEDGVRAVWNSPGYHMARRLAVDPRRADREAGLVGSFCHGCSRLFETTKWGASAEHHFLGEVYPGVDLEKLAERRRGGRRSIA